MNFDSLIKFVQLTHAFQQIKREMFATGEDRSENDLEHSGQLALVAWYIANSNQLPLDKDLLIKYSLVHDLVEVYAGDTPIFSDQSVHNTKAEREEEARLLLIERFPEFPDLHDLILDYEHQNNKEAQFVYALDKLLPAINIYLDGGRTWKSKNNVNLSRLVEYKIKKIGVSSEIEVYFKQLVTILEADESNYFNI